MNACSAAHFKFSLADRSVDDAGVGGSPGLGMFLKEIGAFVLGIQICQAILVFKAPI